MVEEGRERTKGPNVGNEAWKKHVAESTKKTTPKPEGCYQVCRSSVSRVGHAGKATGEARGEEMTGKKKRQKK